MAKKIALLTTTWWLNSHADLFGSKILEGYLHDGGDGPDLELASTYIDRPEERGAHGTEVCKAHGVPVYERLLDALTLGGTTLAVDGVIICACQGDYPRDALWRPLRPARQFWELCALAFRTAGRGVPVFFSKQIAPTFADARAIVDQAAALNVPLLSGSNMTCTYRGDDLRLQGGGRYGHFVAAGASQFTRTNFEHFVPHTLDCLQSQAERRAGGPTGVRAVTCRTDSGMWDLYDQAGMPPRALESLVARMPAGVMQQMREGSAGHPDSGIIVIEYRDGTKAVVLHLDGGVDRTRLRCWVAALPPGNVAPEVVSFECQSRSPFGHFSYQLRDVDRLFQTGVPPYPIGRQLVGAGILDAALRSRAAGGVRVETPELNLVYTAPASDYLYDTEPMPQPFERVRGEARTKRREVR